MSTTPTSLSEPASADSARVSASLAALGERRRTADRAEADVLTLAVQVAGFFPVTESTSVAGHGDDSLLLDDPGEHRGIGGPGTPPVAERAVVEVGATLGVSYAAALALVAEAVELVHRLPRLWALVHDGRLQAWKARRVATYTQPLSIAAADFVDRQVAMVAIRNRLPGNLPGLVHEALVQCDPETAEGVEEAALTARGVWFDYRAGDSTATSHLTAALDTLDALDLDATLGEMATSMGRLGDTSSYDVRRAHALGMLANPQHSLDVFGDPRTPTHAVADATDTHTAADPAPDAADGLGKTWPNRASAVLYLHLEAADLAAHVADGDTAVAGRVEKLGAATLELLRDWLSRTRTVSIRPVLDPRRLSPVDQHDPPAPMREAVILRDGHCVFPGCTVDARGCDLDHIDPFVDPAEGGPPGQTSMANLACLCRRHHRLKTFTGWRYHRPDDEPPDDQYEWSSPFGFTFVTSATAKR